MSLHLVLIYILQILEDYKLMRHIDDSALTELIQKMRTFLDDVATLYTVHEEEKVNIHFELG